MAKKLATQAMVENATKIPPPQTNPEKEGTGMKNCCPNKSKKGQRGFIEGCLFTLCCCWVCEACF